MTIILVIISLSLLILVHEAGHFFAAKMFGIKVNEFGIGFPPRLFSRRLGETLYSINLLPFGGFVKIYGDNPGEDSGVSDKDKMFRHQPAWKKSIVILAGVVMNLVLAWLAFTVIFSVGSPMHLAISDVVPESPAQLAGIETGDIVLSVGLFGETPTLIDPITSGDLIDYVQSHPGEKLTITTQRGGEEKVFEVVGRINPPTGQGSLGVALVDIGVPQKGFWLGLWEGLNTTLQGFWLIVVSFISIIARIFTSPSVLDTLTGPVGIFVLAKEAGSLGIIYLLQIVALISLNLAVLNLIPFPALDGGRFIMILVEKIKGSPVPQNFQVGINALGFALLLILMVVVTIKDVGRFFT